MLLQFKEDTVSLPPKLKVQEALNLPIAMVISAPQITTTEILTFTFILMGTMSKLMTAELITKPVEKLLIY